jgi:hypothetical protein
MIAKPAHRCFLKTTILQGMAIQRPHPALTFPVAQTIPG